MNQKLTQSRPQAGPLLAQSLLAAAVAVGCLLLSAPALSGPLEEALAVTDRNKDGAVDRGEYQARQSEVFYMADTDKDGMLSPGEASLTADLVKQADRNGDGKLSMQEFMDARSIAFRRADSDGNGSLSLQELQSAK